MRKQSIQEQGGGKEEYKVINGRVRMGYEAYEVINEGVRKGYEA